MSKYVNRRTLIEALKEANVEFDGNATVPELRKMYDEYFGNKDKEVTHSDEYDSKIVDALPQNPEVSADLIKSIVDAVLKSHSAAKISEVFPAVSANINTSAGVEYNSNGNEVKDAMERDEVERLNREIAKAP